MVRSLLASAAVLALLGSGAFAAEQIPGKIIKLDRASHQITLQRGQAGQTVGSGAAGQEQFFLPHDPSYEALKVGDQVMLKVEVLNGVRQVTQYDKQ